MKLNENNLLGAVNELREKGYQDNYEVRDEHLICTNTNKKVAVDEFDVENGFQFEISENNELTVIYCMEGGNMPESIFIYGIFEK